MPNNMEAPGRKTPEAKEEDEDEGEAKADEPGTREAG
jgi:hypothetical protein